MSLQLRLLTVLLSSAGSLVFGAVQAQPAVAGPAQCQAFKAIDLSPAPDTTAHVAEAKWVPTAGGTGPGYCEMSGTIEPSVEFLARLPSSGWNGKFIHMGCGGPCGVLSHISGCDDPLRRGYACIVSDGGHKTDPNDNVKWASGNLQSVVEYLVRSSHVTSVAGKALTQRYYKQAPRKSYFMGCSGGGVQAMFAAQRYPSDFDGIVAGGPALNVPANAMAITWMTQVLAGKDGQWLLTHDDHETLHEAVVQKCDMNDGVKDGLIGDPRECHFDPAEIRCTRENAGKCLTPAQVEAVRKIYRGPVNSRGEQVATPMTVKGSERLWSTFTGDLVAHPTPFVRYVTDWFRYVLAQPGANPTWTPDEFDFDRDPAALGAAEIVAPINPDLRRFKSGGGKLIMYTGWNDVYEGVLRTIDYYETTEKTMGGRSATHEFFRLFVVPGMNHCAGGDGTGTVDWLSALEAWVEQGQAPDSIVGAHIRADDLDMEKETDRLELQRRGRLPLDPAYIEFTRPVYPYPTRAKYSGRGNPKAASSFRPVQP